MEKTKQLGTEPVGKLLLIYSIPAIIAMMVNAIYNVVDRIFIAQFAGENALAGLTIAFPIMMLSLAFAALIASGSASLMSIKLGKEDYKGASRTFGNSITMGVLITGLLVLVFYPKIDFFLKLFGGEAVLIPYASSYLKIILVGFIFQIIGFILSSAIRIEGHPNLAMVSMLVGAISNIALDYVFIAVLKMGVQGAGYATIIGQILSFTVLIAFYLRKKSMLKYSLSDFKLKLDEVWKIITVGFTGFISTIGTSIATVFLNISLTKYGGTTAITAMGAIGSLSTLFIMPMLGVQQGMQPIIGYNYGGNDKKRVTKTLLYSILGSSAFAIIAFVFIMIRPETILAMFLDKGSATIPMAVEGLKYSVMLLPLISINLMGVSYFQSTAQSKKAVFLGSLRQFLLIIPLVLILPLFLGLKGVWMTTPLADGISIAIVVLMLFKEFRMTDIKGISKKQLAS